jgi:hypothetical protein
MNSGIYNIKRLLNLYYAGLTSREDEQRLVDYMLTETNLPDELIPDRDIILASIEQPDSKVPASLESDLSNFIDSLAEKERKHSHSHHFVAISGIAASVAIVISLIVFLAKQSHHSPYEITDPQTACIETEKALIIVSESLSKADELLGEANRALSLLNITDTDSIDNAEF